MQLHAVHWVEDFTYVTVFNSHRGPKMEAPWPPFSNEEVGSQVK